eukprot:g3497.t1
MEEEYDSLEETPSAFSEGLTTTTTTTTRQSVLYSGCSDDSDLPRLSPIRTRSDSDLNKWERSKQKLLHISHPQITEGQGESTETLFTQFSLQTDFGGYPPTSAALFNQMADITDLCLSPEGATATTMTTTSGNGSALSEDVWQMVSSTEFPVLNSDITTTTTTATLDEQNTPTVASSSARFTNRSLSSLFDSLTTSIHKGLFQLAVKVERSTSDANRVSTDGMRCVSDIKPDNSFYEVQKSSEVAGNTIIHSINKVVGGSPIHKQDSASYDLSFTLNGGQELYDKLESLCNDYAKKLNKQRKNLQNSKKSELDCFMTRLYPIFDVVGSPTESEDEGRETGAQDNHHHLSHFHHCLDELVGKSVSIACQKERSAILEIANFVANPVNVLGSASSIPLTPQTSRIAELYVELEAATQFGKHSLELIHEEGIQRMAELSTCCVKYLLEIASELTSKSSSSSISEKLKMTKISGEYDLESPSSPTLSPLPCCWPNNGEEIALMLRAFAIRLIHNLEAVTAAFLAALIGVGNSYDENLRDYTVGQKANALASDLELDSCSAVRKVQESLRNLMYVVVYTTFSP